jgi:hypothetical protein
MLFVEVNPPIVKGSVGIDWNRFDNYYRWNNAGVFILST